MFTRHLTIDQDAPLPLFACDVHLGRLARLLRLMGFDTLWRRDWTDPALARLAANEGRRVLTRSRALMCRRELRRSLLVADDDPDRQAAQVLREFGLVERVRLWGRCTRCNGPIRAVARDEVSARIPPKTARWLDEYFLCADCDQLYWQGTHAGALADRVALIRQMARS